MENGEERIGRIKVYLRWLNRLKELLGQTEVTLEEIEEVQGVWLELEQFKIAVKPTQEVLYEAEILDMCARLLKKATNQIKTSNQVTLDDFAQNLKERMLGKDPATYAGMWSKLAVESAKLFPVHVYSSKLLAPEDNGGSEAQLTEKKVRKKRVVDETPSQRTQPTQITEEEAVKNDELKKTEIENMNKVFKQMKTMYKKTNQKPLSYLNCVVDPTSFSKTVENIFTLSFLVRDNYVQMSKNGKNELVLTPIGKQGADKTSSSAKKQMVFSMSYATWKLLVDKMKMKQPCLRV